MKKYRLVFLHIPKTAGTTLIERLWHNDNFLACDRQSGKPADVVFGHLANFSDWETPDTTTIYVTALRDPVERIMSQYNFNITQLTYMNPHSTVELDFHTWFINKGHMRPMRYTSMVDFLNQSNGRWRNDSHEYDTMYSNQILTWNGSHTVLDTDRRQHYQDIKSNLDGQSYKWFMDNTAPRISHFLDTSGDIVTQFRELCDMYDISFSSEKDITRTNVTSQTLKYQGRVPVVYDDLPQYLKDLVVEDTEYDRRLYDSISISTHT